MRFSECLKSVGKLLHGNNYLWSIMEKSSVSRMQRYKDSDSVSCLGKVNQNPIKHCLGRIVRLIQRFTARTELWSSRIFSQDSPHCSSATQRNSKDGVVTSMFNDITCGTEDTELECIANAAFVSSFAERFLGFLKCLKSVGKLLRGNNDLWSIMKKSSVSQMQRFKYSRNSVSCLGKVNQNPTSNTVWEEYGLIHRFTARQNFGHN